MSAFIVCPLSRLHETIRSSGARAVLTLMMRSNGIPDLSDYGIERHDAIEFSDIVEPRDGYVLADRTHIDRILDFTRSGKRTQPSIIHCFAGISRSTAAAFIAACDLMPERSEAKLAANLRHLSPSATPNMHLVRLADEILKRNGRMVEAVHAIGRGADAFEGNVFRIPLHE